jgi:quercetin dioxygenase-like cupin family protein
MSKTMGTEKVGKPRIPGSQVLDLAGLVEYGEGAVVSRTLVENDAGTVTVFAFDADQALSEHTVPFDALVQVVDGQGDFIIGGKRCELRTGQIVLMPANIAHAVRATVRFKMLLTMFRAKVT